MAKTRTKSPPSSKSKPDADRRSADRAKSSDSKPRRHDGTRETIESVVVAFILAFLFRTFEAEAFVIPTGSMAPTLLGRHKDVQCEQCKIWFTVGASDELGSNDQFYNPFNRLESAFCPNCRYKNPIRNVPVFTGDRILVNKFPYEFAEPKRFDVVVFKYPEDPTTNYIKRLVGRPGEEIKIERGDVYVRRGGTLDDWQIVRKQDPDKQRELQLLVFDNDHPETRLHDVGWPERWAPVTKDNKPGGVAGWSETDDGWTPDLKDRTFALKRDRSAEGLHWIRYRHILPTQDDWEAVTSDPPQPPVSQPRPQLISDFCGYNAYTGGQSPGDDRGIYWVGDLTLSCEVDLREAGPKAELLFELNEGVRRYRCRIDPHTGKATLVSIEHLLDRDRGIETVLATANTDLNDAGTYDVCFANVDDRLCLWIDGDVVDFGGKAEYAPPGLPAPQQEDLIPVGIAGRDVDVQVSHLLLQRDIYYRSEHVADSQDYRERPDDEQEYTGPYGRSGLSESLSDPDRWYEEYEAHTEPAVFSQLGPDEFFVLGDNSPRSKDSRLWSNTRRAKHRYAVPYSALVGKAFFIYWPHGVPFGIPGVTGDHGVAVLYHKTETGESTDYPSFWFPFYPHVTRMHRIR